MPLIRIVQQDGPMSTLPENRRVESRFADDAWTEERRRSHLLLLHIDVDRLLDVIYRATDVARQAAVLPTTIRILTVVAVRLTIADVVSTIPFVEGDSNISVATNYRLW